MKKLFVLLCAFFLTFAVYGGYSSSKSSYSSSSSSSRPSSSSSSSSSSRPSSSGKSYSSGKSSSSAPAKRSSFFGKAEKAQAKADSKASYEKYKVSQQPKTESYKAYKASPQSYDYLKSQPKEAFSTRTTREQTVFKTYYSNTSTRPTVVYHDTSWNPFFWMWLVDHQDKQAEWVYHHRDQLSEERYKDLLTKNKDLETQIKALEEKKLAKDPNYSPAEVDKDLMYSDEYVKQVQKDQEAAALSKQEIDEEETSSWIWIGSVLVTALAGWMIWEIFFKKRRF